MPSPIDRLQQKLAATLRALIPEGRVFPSTGVENMRQTVERIRREVGERTVTPSKDRICGALRKLREQGAHAMDGVEFWFACWGLTEPCGNRKQLIEDRQPFGDFMSEVKRRKPSTLAWQGLLDAYFRYTPGTGSVGASNWRSLRDWLATDLPALRKRTSSTLLPHLTWLAVLQENRGLLSDDPCRPYAAEALRGGRSGVDRIKSALGITEASWFWPRLILSQVDDASGYRDDARFKPCLENLIAQLGEHPTVRDDGLARLLTRYAACTDHPAHEGLKQFALDAWGSPQLAQQAKWGLVEPSVKAMVSEWLALEDLEDFFQRLQAGGLADTRRLAFWKRFIRQISFSHIALSNHLWWSRHPDWVEFKQKKRGRISRLDGGGGGKNAFIMKVGGFYFVEFGETGDACYGYAVGNEPFTLGSGLLNYPNDLKDRSKCVFWGSHRGDSWEGRFLYGSDSWQGLSDLGIRT